ncbi:MAG TPA: HAD family hydrolase [Planctomycetota bacterium]|nr:HAD family hydrolase [Planctomycetota bacterium]
MKKAIFLDRDGVVNQFPGADRFVLSWSEFQFIPGIRENLRRLRDAGYFLSLATNQSGVGRGLMTLDALHEIHANMQRELGVDALDAIYFCPHHPDERCVCRKPSPEMILRACSEHGLDPRQSVMIGDSGRDIEMGAAAGCRTILCREKLPEREKLRPEHRPDAMFRMLSEAVEWVLGAEC